MNRCAVALLCAVCVLALCGCDLPGTKISFAVKEGREYCEVFTTPAPWVDVPQNIGGNLKPIMYRWPVDSRRAILITPGPTEEVDYSTKEKFTGRMLQMKVYRVSLSIPVRLRLATEGEWNKGVNAHFWPIPSDTTYELLQRPRGVEEIPDVERGKKDPRWFSYQGERLEKSGDIWASYLPIIYSPEKHFVALQSWNGYYIWGKAPYSGDLFMDVYRLPSRKPLARITGSWNDYTPDGVQSHTIWLTDNDLILPFNLNERSFLLCHFPQ